MMIDLVRFTQTLRERGVRLQAEGGRLKVRGNREAITRPLRQAIQAHSAALLRQDEEEQRQHIKSLQDEHAPLLLELWGCDVIGPLACWLWFEVERLPMDVWIGLGFYADLEFYERIKRGIETGPAFKHKALLRSTLKALYDFIEGGSSTKTAISFPLDT